MQSTSIPWELYTECDGGRADVARASLHSLSFTRETQTPIHVTRVSSLFRRYYPNDSVSAALEVLSILGEAHKLPNGYWLPASCHAVQCSSFTILIATHPTEELSRALGGAVRKTQFARITGKVPSPQFESLSLNAWLAKPDKLDIWAKQELVRASRSLEKTIEQARRLQIYRSWRKSNGPDLFNLWATYPNHESDLMPNGILLAREETALGQTRYFFGEFLGGKLLREADLKVEPARMRYGIDTMNKISMPIQIVGSGGKQTFALRTRLPWSESKLMLALAAEASLSERRLEIAIDNDLAEFAIQVLNDLGLDIKRTK